jgi:putative flippase GtrA
MGDGDAPHHDYPAVTVESSQVPINTGFSPARVRAGMRKRKNWEQLAKFCVVGVTGYAVNLAVYAVLLDGAGLHYMSAAVGSFLVAVTNNYLWNRLWTFRAQRGGVAYQGMRFLIVSIVALGINLAILRILVEFGAGKILAQAIAVVLVTPFSFSANKLWSFRR